MMREPALKNTAGVASQKDDGRLASQQQKINCVEDSFLARTRLQIQIVDSANIPEPLPHGLLARRCVCHLTSFRYLLPVFAAVPEI